MDDVCDECQLCGGDIFGGQYRSSGLTRICGHSADLFVSVSYGQRSGPTYRTEDKGERRARLLMLLLGVTVLALALRPTGRRVMVARL